VEVAAFLDELWQLVQNTHVFLDQTVQYITNGYPNSDVIEAVKEQSKRVEEDRHRLTGLINSTRIRAKLAYVYGEANELMGFNEIINLLRPIVTEKLSLKKPTDWAVNSGEIHSIFKNQLDPARGRLELSLMKTTRISAILRQLPCLLNRPKTDAGDKDARAG